MPKFKHDCDTCVYLETRPIFGINYDIYFCKHSLIARYGNRPNQYLSADIKELLWAELKSTESVLKNAFADNLDKFNIVLKKEINNVSST